MVYHRVGFTGYPVVDSAFKTYICSFTKPSILSRLIFTVTNELNFDQRMLRICSTLAENGNRVVLAGRKIKGAPPLESRPFVQKRISCWAAKGPLMYAEFNIRLFGWLLFQRADLVCAIDLDTILPCLLVSRLKGWKRVYDAHEFFTEQKEIVSRPWIHRIWTMIERWTIPQFQNGYTVNDWIAQAFRERYGVRYDLIRNLPYHFPLPVLPPSEKIILYQGAVNEGRCFEYLIPAMQQVDALMHIYGKGNFVKQTKSLIYEYSLQHKIKVKEPVSPETLRYITASASIGITLFDGNGLNQVHSLANRFFDYIMAGIPQICMNYPEYRAINEEFGVALLLDDYRPETIAAALNKLLSDPVLYNQLQSNSLQAREELNWSKEKDRLSTLYNVYLK